MRSTVFAMLILCCCLGMGCESLNRLTRRSGSPTGKSEQLSEDAKRRQASEQLAARSPSTELLAKQTEKARQEANFPPATPAINGSVESLLAQANQAERSRQFPAARALYEQVLQASPRNSQAHHRLGVLADQDGHYAEAQNHYQVALSQEPENPILLSDIGYSFYSQDRLDDAEQYLQESLRVQPNNEIARNNLAQVYGRRAQQTGSQSDYQLARDQFAMANGPQGVDERMQQLYPPTPPAESRAGILNPFKKRLDRNKSQVVQAGSELQAPDPELNKETQKFIKSFEQLKQEAIRSGEYKTSASDTTLRGQRTPAPSTTTNVPLNQLNSELARIDQDAQWRRERALRELGPLANRRPARPAPAQPDEIEQVGSYEDATQSVGRPFQQNGLPSINPNQSRRPGPGMMPQEEDMSQFAGTNFNQPSNMPRGWKQQNADPQAVPTNTAPGHSNTNASGDPSMDQSWSQQARSSMSQSWPETGGSPNQFDAGGQRWDGESVMRQDQVAPGTEQFGGGPESNPQAMAEADARIPGYSQQRLGAGTADRNNFSARGLRVNPASSQTQQVLAPEGWGRRDNSSQGGASANPNNFNSPDDGRQTAAQLGLDAGMDGMFPDSAVEQPVSNSRRQGRAPFGPRNSQPLQRNQNQSNQTQRNNSQNTWPSVDPHDQSLQAPAMTPGGMRQGGAGMMSPTDYAPQQTGFRSGGYPQGASLEMNDHSDSSTESNGAWGQSSRQSFDPRNAVRPRRPVYNDAPNQTGARGVPGRPNYGSSQNFGAPPMDFGR